METKHPLKPIFAQLLDSEKMYLLSRFFQRTLSVRDATFSDVKIELAKLRDDGCDDFDRILGLYEYLRQLTADSPSGRLRWVYIRHCGYI
jgi:hypothetical protein